MDHLLLKIRLLLLSWFHLHPSPPGPISLLNLYSLSSEIRMLSGYWQEIIDNSHGAAYKAIFQDGSVAMVKEIRDFDEEEEAFYKEVLLLGCLHHRHIVSLCGFSTGRKRFLVFENIENGTLKDRLNDPLKTPLNWRTRLHIVIGVAAALEYLYFFCNPPMYHVSVSSSTILLDENYNAKLCNIGILGSRPNNVTLPQSSCTKECDGQECGNVIFQLGLLILELITGQSSEDGGAELIQWVQEYRFSKTVHKVLDPDLGDNYDSRELKGLLAVARLCTKSVDKPTAFTPQVFRYLQKKIGIAVA
ncbi:hypothetical protein RHGRI_037845 [Rhododendron griersonianum]|uniref:Protein kinase domain-containing protein n=1 Tax=Rhododendron griersonianum TaxID=479676 RepID=A0AAV6HXI1_9ERIC|nr:hypothetical protein RHGRI_037845 [Rhododendron griersonianum]